MSTQPHAKSITMQPSVDGYLRLSFETLANLKFVRRRSWEDASLMDDLRCEGIQTSCAGYCEWETGATPCVSIGWAWFDLSNGKREIAPGGISTNVMLVVQKSGYDLGVEKTGRVQRAWVSGENWQPEKNDSTPAPLHRVLS